MQITNLVRFVTRHPLGSRSKARALMRVLRWQVATRLLPWPVVVPFVNDAKLVVTRGMTGATGNVYVGLHEFEEMAFLLHFLRPSDLFVDVGANVGSYTVLASAGVGADCIAFEPIAQTFGHLLQNLRINDVATRVRPQCVAVGRASGTVRMTRDQDTVNHAVSSEEGVNGFHGAEVEVPVVTLDDAVAERTPSLMKVDVEGFETEVFAGAKRTLEHRQLQGLIVEMNGSGRRYGFDEDRLQREIESAGFRTCRYEPFSRRLTRVTDARNNSGNVLFVREFEAAAERCRTAPRFRVNGADV